MRHVLPALTALVGLALAPSSGSAQELSDLELTVPIAIVDRSAAIAGATPAEGGYTSESGMLAGLEARLYLRMNRYFQVGPAVGAAHQAGPFFGAGGHAFRTTLMDLGVTARALLPCMSEGDRRVHIGAVLGVTGAHADAGEGSGGLTTSTENERQAAATALDHAGVGWRLALDFSVHMANFVAGLGLGVRQYFGVDSPVERGLVMDLGLRLGGRIDLDRPL